MNPWENFIHSIQIPTCRCTNMKWKPIARETRWQRVNTENYCNNCFQFLVYCCCLETRTKNTVWMENK